MREVVLSSVSTREVGHGKLWGNASATAEKPEDVTSWILTDETNPLGDWQKASALEHWKGAPDIWCISESILLTTAP
jgi:hypothetical protein